MTSAIITHEQLKSIIHYHAETGIFTRIKSVRKPSIGVMNLALTEKGYLRIVLLNKSYLSHRIAWFYVTRAWPKNQIDHINNIKVDNRLTNLREANNSQNQKNAGLRNDNSSGYKGVNYHKITGKWRAQIRINSKKTHLGLYTTAEDASRAYEAGAKLHHGDFYYKKEH